MQRHSCGNILQLQTISLWSTSEDCLLSDNPIIPVAVAHIEIAVSANTLKMLIDIVRKQLQTDEVIRLG